MSSQLPKIRGATLTPTLKGRKSNGLCRVFSGVLFFSLLALHAGYGGLNIPCISRTGDPRIGTVTWGGECDAPGQECGHIIVPKDYFDPSAGTASISVARVKATRPKKGTLFLNSGGPGNAGTRAASVGLAAYLGNEWDILGFDPRGIHLTAPAVRCFANTPEFELFKANTVLEQGFTVPSIANLSDPALEAALGTQSREFIALKKAQGQICGKNMGDDLRYMGSATVVRDMAFMADVFDGEGAKINLMTGSYGAILGAYLVNMLPERAGHVVIDGIVDPVNWSSEPSHKWTANWLSSTEKTYTFFLETCAEAGPTRCPISQYAGESYTELEQRLENFFDALAVAPMPVPFALRPGFLTSGAARGLLLMYLEQPREWSDAAHAFAAALAGNGAALLNKLLTPGHDSSPNHDLARSAVTCLDSPHPSSAHDIPTAEVLASELMHVLRDVSPHFGASLSIGEPDGGCEYWPARAPERFTGPWNATLAWPMLIVSNTMDPITPIASGLRVNKLMGNSSLLVIQDGPGHCSSSVPMPCMLKLVQAYFAGTLPANGTVCPPALDYSWYFPESVEASGSRATLGFEGEESSILAGARALEGMFRRRA
ncbi:TAP-like protein-domain-containing protein [Mycena capillaripes]|nr:TAP-like protein-domain-containing protein [Mycena capillaripes]